MLDVVRVTDEVTSVGEKSAMYVEHGSSASSCRYYVFSHNWQYCVMCAGCLNSCRVRHGVMDHQTKSLKLFSSHAEAYKAVASLGLMVAHLSF